VSPGQWGSVAVFAFFMACVGGIVVNRAARADVTYAFIAFYCALLFGRSIYLGEPIAIPLHRLESGALLLFTFFMISDPKTTPNSRAGRVLFAGLVAFGAWYVQFRLFRTNGLLWSLAAWSITVPLIDQLLPGSRYAWSSQATIVSWLRAGWHSAAGAWRSAGLLVGRVLPASARLRPGGPGAPALSLRQRPSESRH
jgi:Na+-translocating ferredoxin:NAD+ oxidoreductase RnfD subunit